MVGFDEFFLERSKFRGSLNGIFVEPLSPVSSSILDKDFLVGCNRSGGDKVNFAIPLLNDSITSVFIECIICISPVTGVFVKCIYDNSGLHVRPDVIVSRRFISDP